MLMLHKPISKPTNPACFSNPVFYFFFFLPQSTSFMSMAVLAQNGEMLFWGVIIL